jgi:hypothetical protein
MRGALPRLLPALAVLLLCGRAQAVDRNAFTFTQYDLQVRVEPEQERFGVRGRITLRNDSAVPQKVAVLQISSALQWRAIRLAGATPADDKSLGYTALEYPSDIDHTGSLMQAVVNLPTEVAPQGTVELNVAYEGTLGRDAKRLTRVSVPADVATRSDWDALGTRGGVVRGLGYVAWYPVSLEAVSLSDGNAVFAAIANWKVRHEGAKFRASFTLVTPPESRFSVVCNATGAGGTGVCEYDSLGETVPAFAIGEYESGTKANSVVHFLPDNAGAAAVVDERAEELAVKVRAILSAAGEKLELVEVPDLGAAPWESGTMLFLPFSGGRSAHRDAQLVHSLGHTVFHTPRPWLAEGVAGLMQLLWQREQTPAATVPAQLGALLPPMIEAEKTVDGPPLVRATDEVSLRLKSLAVLAMLRDMIGEDKLLAALKAYRAAEDKEPAYFQSLIAKQTTRDLEWFFDDWVYRDRGLPDFHIESANARKTLNETYIVAVVVENTGTAGAEVPVTVHTEKGDIAQRLEVRAKAKAVIRIDVPFPPLEVTVNDGSVPEANTTDNHIAVKGE